MKRYIRAAIIPLSEDSRSTKGAVAYEPTTRPGILAQLSNSHDWWVLEGVANNPNTSIEVLEQLAKHPDPDIRRAVLKNPMLPETLKLQIQNSFTDFSGDVRYLYFLEHLTDNDPNSTVIRQVIADFKSCLDDLDVEYSLVEFVPDLDEDEETSRMFDVVCLGVTDMPSLSGDPVSDVALALYKRMRQCGWDVTDWETERLLK